MKKVLAKTTNFLKEQPVTAFFILFLIFSLLFVPKFATPVNIGNIIVQSTDLIIISCGMVFVVMNGGIDFSVTSNIATGSIVGAMIMSTSEGWLKDSPYGWIVAVLAMLAIGLGIGAINGFSVTVLKMPSFIATMVTQLIFGGLALWLPASRTITDLPDAFMFLEQKDLIPGIRTPIVIALAVILVAYYILHKTVFGRHLFAIGINHKTSKISGVSVKKVIFKTFLICGFLGALGGIIMTARIGAGVPDLGYTIFLDILASIIIGGTSITGGKGSIWGAAMGALFIIILNNSMSCLGMQWYVQNVCKGLLVLVTAVLDIVKQRSAA